MAPQLTRWNRPLRYGEVSWIARATILLARTSLAKEQDGRTAAGHESRASHDCRQPGLAPDESFVSGPGVAIESDGRQAVATRF